MKRSRFADPTMAHKLANRRGNAKERKTARPTTGYLIDYGDRVVLYDMRGNDWSADRISWVGGAFGYGVDGVERQPRAYKFGTGGQVLVEGDQVVIIFTDGNPEAPMIAGGVRKIRSPEEASADPFFSAQPIGGDPNPLKARVAARDPVSDAITGHVELECFTNGNQLEIRIGGSVLGGPKLRVLLDFDTGNIALGKGAELHPIPLGDAIVSALADLAADIATTAAAVPVVLPIPPLPGAAQVALDCTESLINGAPFLSSVVKVE